MQGRQAMETSAPGKPASSAIAKTCRCRIKTGNTAATLKHFNAQKAASHLLMPPSDGQGTSVLAVILAMALWCGQSSSMPEETAPYVLAAGTATATGAKESTSETATARMTRNITIIRNIRLHAWKCNLEALCCWAGANATKARDPIPRERVWDRCSAQKLVRGEEDRR